MNKTVELKGISRAQVRMRNERVAAKEALLMRMLRIGNWLGASRAADQIYDLEHDIGAQRVSRRRNG